MKVEKHAITRGSGVLDGRLGVPHDGLRAALFEDAREPLSVHRRVDRDDGRAGTKHAARIVLRFGRTIGRSRLRCRESFIQ